MALPSPEVRGLSDVLQRQAREGLLYEKSDNGKVRCFSCGHRCLIPEGKAGICLVRYNKEETLFVPYGYVGALQLDPVEKKPFFHAYPGSLAMSFGMLGCDYHCGYCQNWYTSQSLRDSKATAKPIPLSPKEFVNHAKQEGARIVTSTYNEPLITSEWAVEIFKVAKKEKLITSYVSNGNGTAEVLEFIRPWVDLYKVDLKGFDDKHYRQLGGVLPVVLETIGRLYEMGFWLEVVTLIVPDFNDSEEELRGIAQFLAGISREIPWHITAFHKDYKMKDHHDTSIQQLLKAYEIGKEEGLHFVYPGNRPGEVGNRENTYCPSCNTLLIERYGFQVLSYHLKQGGHCPKCNLKIPGRWD
ncbi:MAG: AmmeMemoRadiSam system radical SAM enzyme [Deltaproteobacteria bacterium]|nr:AmmeMemoRadiSam system radical SAM enzyme [Deltaproteobacteria bacterium]